MTRAFGRNLNVTTKAPLLFWEVSSEIKKNKKHFHFHCNLVITKHDGCNDIFIIFTITDIVILTSPPLSHHWRSTAMPWCWNTTRPDIYYLHSVNLTNGTSVSFPGKRSGHSGVRVMQQDWHLSRWYVGFFFKSIQTVAPARDTFKKCNI